MSSEGGCVIAMRGKNCIAIASDLGFRGEHYITGINTPKVFKIHDTMYIGLTGLLGDISSIKQILEYEISNFLLKENKYPEHFEITNILSHLLYKNRFTPFFTEPILVSIDKNGNPIINSMDVIGAVSSSNKFSVSGVCSEGLYGMCESLWKPEMSKGELFRAVCQCISFTTNRDCLTGMGSSIHIISRKKIESKRIKLRLD